MSQAEFEQLQPIFVDGFAPLVIRFILVESDEEFSLVSDCPRSEGAVRALGYRRGIREEMRRGLVLGVFERAQTYVVNGTPSQEEPHAKQGALDMPLVHDAKSLCNDRQLQVPTLDKLHFPDWELLSLIKDVVEKTNPRLRFQASMGLASRSLPRATHAVLSCSVGIHLDLP